MTASVISLRRVLPPTADIVSVRFVGSLAGIHLWNAAVALFGPSAWFETPGLRFVNLIHHHVWGVAFAIVGAMLLSAIFLTRESRLGRIALALGMFLAMTQSVLTGLTFFDDVSSAAARAVGVWGGIAAVHASCLLSRRRIHRR